MINKSFTRVWLVRSIECALLALGLLLGQTASAATINLTVEVSKTDGTVGSVAGFRYLIEEDTTWETNLGVPVDLAGTTPSTADDTSLSFEFHKSHTPIAADTNGQGLSGYVDGTSVSIGNVPDGKRYFISVVPTNTGTATDPVGGTLSGGTIKIPAGTGTGTVNKTIRVNQFPLPTAQISIWVFEDNNPVNGALDPDERRLSYNLMPDGSKQPFTINLFEAAGQYGMAGGQVTQDAYGNPLGTEYNADGTIAALGVKTNDGFVLTPDDNGELIIKNLPPAKYGVQVVPPKSSESPVDSMWIQTSTIEGTRTIDAWVKANEPSVFVEFGPPGPHVFIGFVRNFDCFSGDTGLVHDYIDALGDPQSDNACAGIDPTAGVGATITGQVVDNHMSRSPNFGFANGTPFEGCRIAINQGIAGRTIYSQACDAEAMFTVDNIPAGSYSLSIWDDALDAVIANHPFNITGNDADGYQVATQFFAGQTPVNQGVLVDCATTGSGTCELGQVPVFNWNHKLNTLVFFDQNENGYRDCMTLNCDDPTQDDVTLHADASATNIRWRDGRMYTSVPIDVFGEAPHDETFPFFHWLVAEVDFATNKATGATFLVDNGGANPGADPKNDMALQADGYVPQPQTVPACGGIDPATGKDVNDAGDGCTHDGGMTRTETGTVLTTGFQGFLGQKNVMEFGKTHYDAGENGGISGVAVYAITRAEDDPRYAAAEEWEPGIPRVQVALFNEPACNINSTVDSNADGISDGVDCYRTLVQPDVDNYPLGWGEDTTGTVLPGPEDIDRNGNGAFDNGDAIEVAWSDSWDDNTPANCGGSNGPGFEAIDTKCFDGLRNWNQIRPGVFDGGYAFSENLPRGYYVVRAYTPPGYMPLREEDKNVDFGDEYAVPQLLPPECVGDDHLVPALLSYATADGVQVVPGDPAAFAAPRAGEHRRLCDTKYIRVADGKNAAADFHYHTGAIMKAAHVVGGVINDLANEFNPNSPTFGEKFAPPWLPVAFYDYKGQEVVRTYTDQFGKYNAMLPSTNTVNIGSPSGVAPNMLTACMNDAGLVEDPLNPGSMIPDPNHNPQYSQFCYTFQYMPGGTTYLDTPVVSVAAFAGSGLQLDCEAADATPMIGSVVGAGYVGPYINSTVGGLLTITSRGDGSNGVVNVPNPSADELAAGTNTVPRNYGFGDTSGSVELVRVSNNGDPFINGNNPVRTLPITGWNNTVITAQVAAGALPNGRYQLSVVNGNGVSSPMGVTLHVGGNGFSLNRVHQVVSSSAPGATPIQDAIDAANAGDLILVGAGTYDELPIMYDPLDIQGAGAFSTRINAYSLPAEKITNWRDKINGLALANQFSLVPGQELGLLFVTEEGPGLTVVANEGEFGNGGNQRSSFDGFTVTGASTGGGIFVSGYAQNFRASNNLIFGNAGTFGGGIRIGHPTLVEEFAQGGQNLLRTPDAQNDAITIRHNMINRNGTLNGAGGGISLYNGSANYRINDNSICGNFAATDGGGIGHLGLSSGGRIEDNQIIFNQSFRQTPGFETDGGGILIAGADDPNGGNLSAGAGTVTILRNLIQGNQAGAGDGAGIALRRVNGQDIVGSEDAPGDWWLVNILNNSIVNNVTGLAGGGISLLDSARVNIYSNTIANNESTATAGSAFAPGSPGRSTAQVAGIAARAHDRIAGMIGVEGRNNTARYGQDASIPRLRNNIIWHNRTRLYDLVGVASPAGTINLLDPTTLGPLDVTYDDLSDVLAVSNNYLARNNLLSDAANLAGLSGTNILGDPTFGNAYVNGAAFVDPASPTEFTTVQVSPALDEGGNWLDVRFAPLSINDVDRVMPGDQASDYHLGAGSAAQEAGVGNRPAGNLDIDREPGTVGTLDIGSDEVQ